MMPTHIRAGLGASRSVAQPIQPRGRLLRRFTLSCTALLLVGALPASADWSITIQGPVTISGPGGAPIVIPTPPVAPPVVVPPVTPPLPPPPVAPPIVDTSPFPFPAAQPGQELDQACRYFNLAPDAGGAYATLPNCRNPLAGSHLFACFTPMGMLYQRTQSIGGFRLYVPRDFPPAKIRLLCAGGAI